MARPKTKTVYERIEEQQIKIKETEELLKNLNEELQALYLERDKEEAEKLFSLMKANGLTIDKAVELLSNINK